MDLDELPYDSQDAISALQSLTQHARSLRNLSFSKTDSSPFSNDLEMALDDLLERRGRSLRGFEIKGTAWPISPRLLRAIAKHCHSTLDSLTLSDCRGLASEAAIKCLLTMRSLRRVKLNGIEHMNNENAKKVASSVEQEILGRSGCGEFKNGLEIASLCI